MAIVMHHICFFTILVCYSFLVKATVRYKSPRTEIKDERQDDYYNFYYSIDDVDSHNFKRETRKDGKVVGSYGIKDPDGRKRTVYYIADKDGFRAKVDSNEPGILSMNPADVEIVKSNQFNHFTDMSDENRSYMPDNEFPEMKIIAGSTQPEYTFPIQPYHKKQYKINRKLLPVSYTIKIDHDDAISKIYKPKEKQLDQSLKPWNLMSDTFPYMNSDKNYISHEK